MSTNIQIDVVLRKLQEQSEQIKAQNQEQRSEREEEAELAQKKAERERKERLAPADNSELTVNEPGQSPPTGEQLRQKEADSKSKALNSSDPDIARTKEEPAGFVAGGAKLMYCWLSRSRLESSNEFLFVTATGSRLNITRDVIPFSAESFGYDGLPEGQPSDPNTPDGGFEFYGISAVQREGYIVLPLSGGKFIYAAFLDGRARGVQVEYTQIDENSPAEGTSSSTELTREYEVCVLIGSDQIKEIPLPAGLRFYLETLYEMPKVVDLTLILSDLAGGERVEVPWLFRVDTSAPLPRTTWRDQASLYGHYIIADTINIKPASPPVYWWLRNADTDGDYDFLPPEQIRQQFSQAQFGRSRGGKWYKGSYIEDVERGRGLSWQTYPDQVSVFNNFELQGDPVRISGPYRDAYAALPNPFINDELLIAWDAGIGSYCDAEAVSLGFRPSDLTF